MGLTATACVLAAAFAHAGWNYFAKRAGSAGAGFVWLTATCSAVLYLPVMLLSLLWTGLPAWDVGLVGVLVSAVIHLGYFLVLQRGYAVGDMSLVYPLARGTGPLLTMLIAVVFLGERPGALGLIGGVAVVLGVFAIGFAGGVPSAHLAGLGFGLVTGSIIAAYTLWDSYAVTTLALSPLLFDWASNTTRSALLAPYAIGRGGRIAAIWKQHRREVLAVAILSPLAYILVLFAMSLAPVALVAPARELSIVVAGLLAWGLLGEAHPGRRLTGAAVVLVGVILLSVSSTA